MNGDTVVRSPKRKRALSPDDTYALSRRRLSPPPGTTTASTPADDEDNDENGYAYESSAPSSPSSRSTPPPPPRPTTLHYSPHLTLTGHASAVSAALFSPSGTHLATASSDSTIKLWTLSPPTCTHTLHAHLAGISALSFSPDSTVLASASDDKTIRLWSVLTGRPYPTPLIGHDNYVTCLAFSPKGNMLVSGSADEAVFLWDVRTARVMRRLPAHSDPVTGVAFVRDGTLVASCSSDGLIRIWDSGTGQCLKTLVHEDNAGVVSVAFSPNGSYVAAGTVDGVVRLWDYVEGRVVKTYLGAKEGRWGVCVAFGVYGAEDEEMGLQLQDGELGKSQGEKYAFIAGGDQDGNIWLWDVNSKEILQTIHVHKGTVLAVNFDQKTRRIVTAGMDDLVKVWQLPGSSADGLAVNGEMPDSRVLEAA